MHLHYRYIIFILSLFIIGLITYILAPLKEVFAYISFAATISSLILAVLAIIQGFMSTNSLTDTAAQLNRASNVIDENAQELKGLVAGFHKKVDENYGMLKSIDSKFSNFSMGNESTRPINKPQAVNGELLYSLFEENTSPTSALLMYAFQKAHNAEVSISTKNLLPIFEPVLTIDDNGFLWLILGVVGSFRAIGILDFKFGQQGDDTLISIPYLEKHFADRDSFIHQKLFHDEFEVKTRTVAASIDEFFKTV